MWKSLKYSCHWHSNLHFPLVVCVPVYVCMCVCVCVHGSVLVRVTQGLTLVKLSPVDWQLWHNLINRSQRFQRFHGTEKKMEKKSYRKLCFSNQSMDVYINKYSHDCMPYILSLFKNYFNIYVTCRSCTILFALSAAASCCATVVDICGIWNVRRDRHSSTFSFYFFPSLVFCFFFPCDFFGWHLTRAVWCGLLSMAVSSSRWSAAPPQLLLQY